MVENAASDVEATPSTSAADDGLEVVSTDGRRLDAVKGSLTEVRDARREVSPHEEPPAVTDELLEALDAGRQ